MERLVSVFSQLDPMRRIVIILATVGMFAAVLMLARTASAPSMSLLYSGLDAPAAGEVIQSLEQSGAAYEVRGSAIFVDGTQRDALRMSLAAEGLPASSTQGYEILDGLSGFGTTAQMFDAAYWRAREGELARTILANPNIRTARVHISNPPQRTFGSAMPGAASVVVTTGTGGLPASQARALRYLVASAVAGLAPDQVSVIDTAAGLIGAAEDGAAMAAGGASDRARAMRANVERLLEARVGYGNAVVEVNIDTSTDREQIVERRFDPDSRVAISTVMEENTSTAQDARSGAVTVASNLPDGDSGGSGGQSSSRDSETREQVNYEVSETQHEILRAPGAVRRVTVAVLVDGIRAPGPDGTMTWQPRPDEELASLRELVASAVGFDEARGDVITLRSMEFPEAPADGSGSDAAPSPFQLPDLDVMRLIQIGVLAVVALILGLFVVRPILAGARPAPAIEPPRDLPPPAMPTPEGASASEPDVLPPLDHLGGDFQPQMAVVEGGGEFPALPTGGSDGGTPVERLRRLVEERRDESASVLRAWAENGVEAAR